MKVILVAVYVTLAIPQQITNPSPVLHRPCVSFLPCRGSNEFERIQSAEGCPWSICKIHSCDPDVDKSRQRPTVWGWKRVAAIPRSRFMLDLTSSELIYARFSTRSWDRDALRRVWDKRVTFLVYPPSTAIISARSKCFLEPSKATTNVFSLCEDTLSWIVFRRLCIEKDLWDCSRCRHSFELVKIQHRNWCRYMMCYNKYTTRRES